jgi:periplasmic protein TonB
VKYLFFLFLLGATNLLAQSSLSPDTLSNVDNGEIFTVVDVMPEYPGGNEAMVRFIGSNTQYPTSARRSGEEGTVFVGFIITKQGDIRDVKTVKGVSPAVNEEAERVIRSMPRWIPGMQAGKNVSVRFVLPIKFNLKSSGKTKKQKN